MSELLFSFDLQCISHGGNFILPILENEFNEKKLKTESRF